MSESCAGGSCPSRGLPQCNLQGPTAASHCCWSWLQKGISPGLTSPPYCWRQGWRERWCPLLSCERQAGTLPVPPRVSCVSVQMFLCISSQGCFLCLMVEWWSAHSSWWGSGERDLPACSGSRGENKLNIQGQIIFSFFLFLLIFLWLTVVVVGSSECFPTKG